MSNTALIQELQGLLSKHFDQAPGRDPKGANVPIFLPNKTCPAGLIACDPNEGSCPSDDHALNPPIYTQDGLRCYTKQGVRKSRLSDGDRDVVVTGVRALVEQLSTLRDVNNQLDKMVTDTTPGVVTKKVADPSTSLSYMNFLDEYTRIWDEEGPIGASLPNWMRRLTEFRGKPITQRKYVSRMADKVDAFLQGKVDSLPVGVRGSYQKFKEALDA